MELPIGIPFLHYLMDTNIFEETEILRTSILSVSCTSPIRPSPQKKKSWSILISLQFNI